MNLQGSQLGDWYHQWWLDDWNDSTIHRSKISGSIFGLYIDAHTHIYLFIFIIYIDSDTYLCKYIHIYIYCYRYATHKHHHHWWMGCFPAKILTFLPNCWKTLQIPIISQRFRTRLGVEANHKKHREPILAHIKKNAFQQLPVCPWFVLRWCHVLWLWTIRRICPVRLTSWTFFGSRCPRNFPTKMGGYGGGWRRVGKVIKSKLVRSLQMVVQ